MKCRTVQLSIVQCMTVKCRTVQYSAGQCRTVQCMTVPCSTLLSSTFQYRTVQYSAMEDSAVQDCTIRISVLYATTLHCSVVTVPYNKAYPSHFDFLKLKPQCESVTPQLLSALPFLALALAAPEASEGPTEKREAAPSHHAPYPPAPYDPYQQPAPYGPPPYIEVPETQHHYGHHPSHNCTVQVTKHMTSCLVLLPLREAIMVDISKASPARSQAMEAAFAYRAMASRTAALLLSILTVMKPNCRS